METNSAATAAGLGGRSAAAEASTSTDELPESGSRAQRLLLAAHDFLGKAPPKPAHAMQGTPHDVRFNMVLDDTDNGTPKTKTLSSELQLEYDAIDVLTAARTMVDRRGKQLSRDSGFVKAAYLFDDGDELKASVAPDVDPLGGSESTRSAVDSTLSEGSEVSVVVAAAEDLQVLRALVAAAVKREVLRHRLLDSGVGPERRIALEEQLAEAVQHCAECDLRCADMELGTPEEAKLVALSKGVVDAVDAAVDSSRTGHKAALDEVCAERDDARRQTFEATSALTRMASEHEAELASAAAECEAARCELLMFAKQAAMAAPCAISVAREQSERRQRQKHDSEAKALQRSVAFLSQRASDLEARLQQSAAAHDAHIKHLTAQCEGEEEQWMAVRDELHKANYSIAALEEALQQAARQRDEAIASGRAALKKANLGWEDSERQLRMALEDSVTLARRRHREVATLQRSMTAMETQLQSLAAQREVIEQQHAEMWAAERQKRYAVDSALGKAHKEMSNMKAQLERASMERAMLLRHLKVQNSEQMPQLQDAAYGRSVDNYADAKLFDAVKELLAECSGLISECRKL